MSEPLIDLSSPDPEGAEREGELSESDLDDVVGGIATAWIVQEE